MTIHFTLQSPLAPGAVLAPDGDTTIGAQMAESRIGLRGFVDMDRSIDFELPDHEGKAWSLADHLERGPALLVFYRGDW